MRTAIFISSLILGSAIYGDDVTKLFSSGFVRFLGYFLVGFIVADILCILKQGK